MVRLPDCPWLARSTCASLCSRPSRLPSACRRCRPDPSLCTRPWSERTPPAASPTPPDRHGNRGNTDAVVMCWSVEQDSTRHTYTKLQQEHGSSKTTKYQITNPHGSLCSLSLGFAQKRKTNIFSQFMIHFFLSCLIYPAFFPFLLFL